MEKKEEFELLVVTDKDLGKLEKVFRKVSKLNGEGHGVHLHILQLDETLEIGAHAERKAVRDVLSKEFQKASLQIEADKRTPKVKPLKI